MGLLVINNSILTIIYFFYTHCFTFNEKLLVIPVNLLCVAIYLLLELVGHRMYIALGNSTFQGSVH